MKKPLRILLLGLILWLLWTMFGGEFTRPPVPPVGPDPVPREPLDTAYNVHHGDRADGVFKYFITKDPNGFYMKKVATPVKVRRLQKKVEKLEKQNAKLKNDIKIIKGSRSYRLGWFLLTIPRKIKAIFKGNK